MKRIFIEREKCDGCLSCNLACMLAHSDTSTSLYDLNLTDPANETRNFIKVSDGKYTPIFCRHCALPECVASCMSGALSKDEESGHVLYDKERCGQCFMCVMNCPFGLPKPDTVTHSMVVKCDFCTGISDTPSCVAACPNNAIVVKEVL